MSNANKPNLTLLIGGVRAGKSRAALNLARSIEFNNPNAKVLFVATAQAFDDEMQQRIALHQQERSTDWTTLETPINIASEIERELTSAPDIRVIVIDCLTLWTSNIMLALAEGIDAEPVVASRLQELIAAMQRNAFTTSNEPREWIVVTNEVGLGIVPPTLLGRQYRDVLGRVNQIVADAASDVLLVVAGVALKLKSRSAQVE